MMMSENKEVFVLTCESEQRSDEPIGMFENFAGAYKIIKTRRLSGLCDQFTYAIRLFKLGQCGGYENGITVYGEKFVTDSDCDGIAFVVYGSYYNGGNGDLHTLGIFTKPSIAKGYINQIGADDYKYYDDYSITAVNLDKPDDKHICVYFISTKFNIKEFESCDC
jgi:hypothetical protein